MLGLSREQRPDKRHYTLHTQQTLALPQVHLLEQVKPSASILSLVNNRNLRLRSETRPADCDYNGDFH